MDAQFLAVEDGRTHGHVIGVGVYDPATAPDGRLTVETVRELVAARIHLLAPLRSKLIEVPFGIDYPYWVEDPAFELDWHIREAPDLQGGDHRDLARLTERIAAQPLDRARPLWQIHVAQGFQDGKVVVLTKLHHAAIDGVSGEQLIATLLDTEQQQSGPSKPFRHTDIPPMPTSAEMLARGVIGSVIHPLRTLRSLPRAVPHLDVVPNVNTLPGTTTAAQMVRRIRRAMSTDTDGAVLRQPGVRAPRTRFNRRIEEGRSVAFTSVSLTAIKEIKSAFGVTVNDVVMAVVSGALRSWLAERDELPDRPMVSTVPISVRAPDDGNNFGNRIGMLYATLPTHLSDPRSRLEFVHAEMDRAKRRHAAVPATLLQDANHLIPPALFGRAARASMALGTQAGMAVGPNLLVSNIPGSPVPLNMAGARLEAQYPVSAIFHNLALNITVLSYLDHMDWGIVGAHDEDTWSLLASIEAEIDRLHAEALSTA
ncbi:wax ester/triacylglycerol synthase family O-acyltransferase [Mycolicibacterium sp. lyk4-40-TYG-92]|uniref:wax ester/triacylglycerol synthase family O-acyltransferase n=1 Tax=Mycolicibacterium sp. lyk4-40-TYG-92 TaxID=3040295 RepID=UPI00254A46B1|nr:wax ester/triacylglycerol synthase family O-acyltransferase [Mycolicibacterium sp. lyk4-40-TYG-92]